MKFDKAQKIENKKERSKSFKKNEDFYYSRLFSFSVHNSVSICLMKPDMRGHFKYLSDLINDSKSVMPWTIKITHINDCWTIFVGCHSSIEKCDIDFSDTFRRLKENNINISSIHNLHILSNVSDKFSVEEIVNLLLKIIEDSKLEIIENTGINIKYTVKSKAGLFIIPDDYLYNNEFDEMTYKKFLQILNKLEKKFMTKTDKKIFHRLGFKLIKNKYINKEERDVLNNFLKKYVADKDRIKLAMSYLLNRNYK